MNASDVLFLDAFYPLFKFMMQIPSTLIINKIGDRKGIITGNILVSFGILVIIISKSLPVLIFSQFLSAFGYTLKNLTETNLLYASIEKNEKRNDFFSRIDGKASSYYYYVDAITSLSTGFLFLINGYLPMIFCFFTCLTSTALSLKFNDIYFVEVSKKKISVRKNLNDIKSGFKFIFQSNRLKSLIAFVAFFDAVLALRTSLQSSILKDLLLPEQYFGIIYAILQIISGVSSNRQSWFHKHFKNRVLTFLSLWFAFSMIVIGLCSIIGLNYGLTLEIILLMSVLQCFIKGPYYTLEKRYLNSFASSNIRTKIYACKEFIYCIIRAIACFFCSWLLDITTTSYVYVILGCIFAVIFILMLDKMRNTVGLKPEEYSEKDIKFVEIK